MTGKPCPSAAKLSAFVLGALPESALEEILQHLDACPTCEAVVATLDHLSDPVVAGLRRAPASDDFSRLAPGAGGSASRGLGLDSAVPRRLGDYQILHELGRGGMGIVFEAEQVSLRRRVALKVLPRHATLDAEASERFRREARAAAKLHHTNIVPVFGTGEQDGLHYFVMQFIPGAGLDRVVRELRRLREGPAPPERGEPVLRKDEVDRGRLLAASVQGLLTGRFAAAPSDSDQQKETRDKETGRQGDKESEPGLLPVSLSPCLPVSLSTSATRTYWVSVARLGMQVADALAFAHAQGVVHRDVKPSNLLLDPHGRLWISDFGLAKETTSPEDLTRSGFLIGTLRYVPPERFAGVSDARGDTYGLGLTLYELLTFRPAFSEADRTRLLHLVMNTEPPRPRRLNPAVPRDLETVVLKAIARDPNQRYQNATDLREDLRLFIEDRPIRARRATVLERLWRAARRDPVRATLLGALFLVCIAGAIGVTAQWWRAEGKARDEASARRLAERAEDDARRNLYFSQIAQARLEWRLNNVAGAEQLLDLCEPARRRWEWHHLRAVNRAALFTLPDPGMPFVLSLDVSPDGRFLAFAGWNPYLDKGDTPLDTVQVWDLHTGKRRLALPGNGNAAALRVTFSPDAQFLVTSDQNGHAQLVRSATGETVRSWKGGAPTFSPDGRLIAAGTGKEVLFWESATGKEVRRFPSSGGRVTFRPDGKHFAVSGPQAVELREVLTGREAQRIPYGPAGFSLHERYFEGEGPDLAFSPDGRYLVTATNPPRIWEAATGVLLHSLPGHTGWVLGVAFAPDGRHVATAGIDGTVRLWDVQNGSEVGIWRGHAGVAGCVRFHPDGCCLLSGGRTPGEIKLWDLTRHPEYLSVPDVHPLAMAFDADGTRLHFVNILGHLRTRNVETGHTLLRSRIDLTTQWLTPARVAVFSGDGRIVATVSEHRHLVKLWDAASGRELHAFEGLTVPGVHVALSHDGGRVAAAGRLRSADQHVREVRVWDSSSQKTLAVFHPATGPTPFVHGVVALSPDGARLAFDDYAGEQARLRIVEASGGRELLALPLANRVIRWVTFSSDGRLLAAVDERGEIAVWDTVSGESLYERHLRGPSYRLEFSPDGSRLAAVDRDKVKVWDVQTGYEVFTLSGAAPRNFDGGFNPILAWSRDGRRLAASNWLGAVSTWGAASAAEEKAGPEALRALIEGRAYLWHLQQGRASLGAGQAGAAVFHLERVLRREPPDARARLLRASLLGRRGAFPQAAADCAGAFAEHDPEEGELWLVYARALLATGDSAGYRRLCASLLSHGHQGRAENGMADFARACVLGPGAADDPLELVDGIDEVRAAGLWGAQALFSLALAHYRAGQFEQALERLRDALAASENRWLTSPALSMVYHKLGYTDEARRWMKKADEWHAEVARRLAEPTGGFTLPWEWADFEILYAEARGVVAGKKP